MKYCLLVLICLLPLSCTDPKRTSVFNPLASTLRADSMGFNPLEETVISSFVQVRQHTMSTLYGNTIAAEHARTRGNRHYPAGAVLSLVTWIQQPDPRWFGGNIPGEVASIEVIHFQATPQKDAVPVYEYLAGNPLRLKSNREHEAERISFIVSGKMSVTP